MGAHDLTEGTRRDHRLDLVGPDARGDPAAAHRPTVRRLRRRIPTVTVRPPDGEARFCLRDPDSHSDGDPDSGDPAGRPVRARVALADRAHGDLGRDGSGAPRGKWNVRAKNLLPVDARVLGIAITTPIVEETAKGIALVVVFVGAHLLHRRFGFRQLAGPTDGLVYGAAVGLGFAFTEDVQYGLRSGVHELVARTRFLRLCHAASRPVHRRVRSWLGNGVLDHTRKVMRVVWPFLGLVVALALHTLNNGFERFVLVARFGLHDVNAWLQSDAAPQKFTDAQRQAARIASGIDIAVFVAAGIGLWLWLKWQRRVITEELTTEAASGLISRRDIELTPRYWRRQRRRGQLIRRGELQRAHAEEFLHIRLARLAFAARRAKHSPATMAASLGSLGTPYARQSRGQVRTIGRNSSDWQSGH